MKIKIRQNKYKIALYLLTFLVPLICCLIGFLAGGYAPFGKKNVLSAGGYSGYLPYYFELYDRVHEGKFLGFSQLTGLGYDFSSIYTYYLADPLSLIILIFPRNCIISIINILYCLKICLSGLFCCIFLDYRKSNFVAKAKDSMDETKDTSDKKSFVIGFKSESKIASIRFIQKFDWVILAFSTIFALSNCMFATGLNISYLSTIMLLPLVMYGLELIINNKSKIVFFIFLFLSIICNIHIGIIVIIFVFLYTVTRDYDSTKSFICTLKDVLLCAALSILCSSFYILSSYSGGKLSSNISLKFPQIHFITPFNVIKQLMTQTPHSSLLLYGNNIDISFGILLIFLIVVYALNNSINIKSRIKNISLLIFLIISIICTSTKYLLNGFSTEAGNSIDYAFIIVFLAIILSFDTIKTINTLKSYRIIISFIVCCSLIVLSMVKSTMYDSSRPFILSLEFLVIYFLISLIFSSKSITSSLYFFIIPVIGLIEITPGYVSNINNLGHSISSQPIYNTASMINYEAARRIKTIDKDAKILIYYSNCSNSSPVTNALSGYDYILISSNDTLTDTFLEKIEDYKISENAALSVSIYKNPYSLKNVRYDKTIENYTYSINKPFDASNSLIMEYFNCDKVFNDVDFDITPSLTPDGKNAQFHVSINVPGDIYFKAYYLNHFGDASIPEKDFLQLVPTDYGDEFYYIAASFDLDKYIDFTNYIKSNNTIQIADMTTPQSFSISADSYISSGFPKARFFKYIVNNKEVNPISIIDNQALIPVNQGQNTVEVQYNYSYIIMGIILSIIGIILSFIIFKKNILGLISLDKISKHLYSNRVYYISLSICTALFVLSQMVARCYPFGTVTTAKGDGLLQFYTFWVSKVESVKQGKIFPTVTYDIGSFYDSYREYFVDRILNPWNIIKYKYIPRQLYLLLFTLDEYLYYSLSSVSIIYYLTHRKYNRLKKNDTRLIIISLLYTLSSFSAVFFSYSAGFRYMPYLPLIVLGMEQLVYKNRKALYICMLVTMMIYDPYQSFLLCEFIALYFLTFHFTNFKDFITKAIRFGICSISSALLTSFILVPFYYSTLDSPYNAEDSTLPGLFDHITSFAKIIADYYTAHSYKAISGDNSQAITYCGLIMLFVIPLYLINKKISPFKRIGDTILILLYFIAINNKMLNFIFHGFHFQSLVPNRFSAFIIFLFVTMLSTIILHYKEYKNSHILIVVTTTSILLAILYLTQYNELTFGLKVSYIILAANIIACVICQIIKSKYIMRYLLYIALIDILVNFIIVFPQNIGSTSIILEKAAGINKLTEKYPNMKDFDIITEYNYVEPATTANIGKCSNINTLSFFHSSYNSGTFEHLSYYNYPVGTNYCYLTNENPMADMMLHVKYIIKDNEYATENAIYPILDNNSSFTIYENPYYLPLGFMINSQDTNYASYKDYKNAFIYQNTLSKQLGGNDLYTEITMNKETEEIDNSDINYYTIDESYEVTSHNTLTEEYIPIQLYINENEKGYVFITIDKCIYLLGYHNGEKSEFSYNYPTALLEEEGLDEPVPNLAFINLDELEKLHDILNRSTLQNTEENGRSISANIDANNDGMLYISLPYYSGWKAYIDGNKVEIKEYLGSMGIPISSGKHSIRLTYYPPGAILGSIISIITLLSIILFYSIKYQHKKVNKK